MLCILFVTVTTIETISVTIDFDFDIYFLFLASLLRCMNIVFKVFNSFCYLVLIIHSNLGSHNEPVDEFVFCLYPLQYLIKLFPLKRVPKREDLLFQF